MIGHPYLIENIIDVNAERVIVNVQKELLSVLGLIKSLDFTPLRHFSKENIRKKYLQKEIFKHDKIVMQRKLLHYQDQHYKNKRLRSCLHCMLAFRKVCKNISFSIGNPEANNVGLELYLFNFKDKNKTIALKCPKILGIIEERVFSSTIKIYASKFQESFDDSISISLFPEVERKRFDFHDVSPIFWPYSHTATPLITNISEIHHIKAEPLYVLLTISKRKDIKIFDCNL